MGTSRKTRPEAQVRIRITKAAFVGTVVTLAHPVAALAHSGKTDSSGGHHCNVGSCAGTYHYHNGGAASPVPQSSGGSSSGAAALPWDWLPLLALLGLAAWVFWFRPQAQRARIHAKAERDRLEREHFPHLTALKEMREAERVSAEAAEWADEVALAQQRAEQGAGLNPGSVLGAGLSGAAGRVGGRRRLRGFLMRLRLAVFKLFHLGTFPGRSDD